MPDLRSISTARWLGALVAAGGLSLASTPVFAQATVEELTVTGRLGPDGQPATLSRVVSYADLDITTPAGQDTLKSRIRDTARDLCNELNTPSGGPITTDPVTTCRRVAEEDALGQMRVAVAQASPRPPGWAAPAPALAAAPPPPPVAPAAESAAAPVAATTTLVTNGPVPDTPENRARYGAPMSNAGKRTAPAGN